MASNFPTSLDAFTNPSSTDSMDSVSVPHATQHADLNDAVESLQAKVGANGSAVASSHDYKIAQLEAGASGGKILQVAQTVKTDVFSTSTQSNVDVTGLSVSITPSAATSKVLVFATVNHSHATAGGHALKLFRDSTEIGSGSGGTVDGFAGIGDGLATDSIANSSINYLDSPATTSATTYKIVVRVAVGGTAYINRRVAADYWRTSCQITVMEVSA